MPIEIHHVKMGRAGITPHLGRFDGILVVNGFLIGLALEKSDTSACPQINRWIYSHPITIYLREPQSAIQKI